MFSESNVDLSQTCMICAESPKVSKFHSSKYVSHNGVLLIWMPYYIPQEILDIIIGYASATSDGPCFSNYAVSHTFVLPYKFRSLSFKGWAMYTNDRDTINIVNGAMVIPIPKFFEAINAGDGHALSQLSCRLYRSWTLKNGGPLASYEIRSKKFSAASESLSKILQNWVWKDVLSPLSSWNNLADLYN